MIWMVHDHSFFYLSLFESSILVDSWIVWPSSMIIYQHHMLTQCFLESWKKSMRKISSLFDFLQSRRCTWDNSRKLTIWKNPSIVDGIYQERWGFSMARLVDRRVYPSIVFNSSRAFFGGAQTRVWPSTQLGGVDVSCWRWTLTRVG